MSENAIEEARRRRHGDFITESVLVVCDSCNDFEFSITYKGDPDAGGIGMAVKDDFDLTTCPFCGADTDFLNQ